MKLWDFINKEVEIVLNTGEVVTGIISDWHDTGEVSDDCDAVSINNNLYLESDIKKSKKLKIKH